MKSRILKRFLKGLLLIVAVFILLMVTPRLWSVIYPVKPPVGYHLEVLDYLAVAVGLEKTINMTPAIPEDIQEIKNIEYKNIDGKSLQLDMYIPKNIKKPSPLLVFIHGGGWRSGQRSDYLVYLVAFAQKGYITATVSYRLLKDGPYPACVEDITDAVQWFYKHGEEYGYNPDRIGLVGGSAGAHLALMAAYECKKTGVTNDSTFISANRHRIKAVVDIYGPIDLTTEYARNQPLVTSFIAHSYAEAPELYMEASPIRYLDKDDPPTMILHGTSDNLVPISQSDLFKAKLDSLGVPNTYYRVPLWPHAMDVAQRVNTFSQLKMNDFFEKYLN
jgi:acetyl esterase/lipase